MARAPVSKFGFGHPSLFYYVPFNQYFRAKMRSSPSRRTGPFHRVPPSWVAKMVASPPTWDLPERQP
jgi:hypothetical protein